MDSLMKGNNNKTMSFSSRIFLESILLAVVFLFRLHLASPEMVEDDVLCLQGFKTSLQYPQSSPITSWDFTNGSGGSVCNFTGISCSNDSESRIQGIDLTSWHLSGQIPESLQYCQRLQTLDLSFNNLSGTIPSQLCSWLPNLVALDLSTNYLSGPIPPSLAKCNSLNTLFLSTNRLNGTIPPELSILKGLTRFYVLNNRLSGRIPPFHNEFGKRNFDRNRELCGEPLAKCPEVSRKKKNFAIPVVALGVSAAIASILFGFWLFKFRAKRGIRAGDESLEQVPGMPTRFSYHDIKRMTQNFSKKLGEGGFSSVFEGTLSDGAKIAVKRLNGFGQMEENSFFAEVKSIGSIHQVNLVRLVGFCTDKSRRLLVYEYMANGSLDRWIFHKDDEFVLTWQQRKKIILHVAKGLNYLHLECHQKIIHLDIKPQNILLDDNFNAKVSDFGLSKLVDKDQSKIVTTMRGTLGYLAPEWLNGMITEKADVYSFGVVILEIICGRKVCDVSQDEEDMYLLSLVKRKMEEDRLLDIVSSSGEDLQLYGLEAENTIRLAAWCLQGDYTKRPSMSTVVKVLEGSAQVEDNLDFDYHFLHQPGIVDDDDAHVDSITHPSLLIKSKNSVMQFP